MGVLGKTAVIFGVTGQDGSYLSELLLEKGYDVVGVVRRSSVSNTTRIDPIMRKHRHFAVVEGDITDPISVSGVINQYQPDECYNLAAQSHVGTSFSQPVYTTQTIVMGHQHVLESVRTCSPETKVYHASTSEMFGDNSSGNYFGGEQPFQDERTPFSPQSPYAVAKVAAHQLNKLYRKAYGMFTCSGILFNHESPRRGENFVTRKITKWMAEFKAWALQTNFSEKCIQGLESSDYIYGPNNSRFPKLHLGNLQAKRDWGHAKDYVLAMWMMMQYEKPGDYVIATGETRSVQDFLDSSLRHMGLDLALSPYFVVVDPEFYRPAEVEYLLGDPSKARALLKWKPEVSFDELVAEMIDSDYARLQK